MLSGFALDKKGCSAHHGRDASRRNDKSDRRKHLVYRDMSRYPAFRGMLGFRALISRAVGRCVHEGCLALTTDAMSTVLEWVMVTVASRCMSSIDTGMPTMFDRPRTTARFPAICTP